MIPAKFDYEVADSVEGAIELLGSSEEAKLIAGGHSLLPLMKLRFARPSLLVDIGRVPDLAYVRDAGDQIAIGALTRHHDVAGDRLLQKHCPIVAQTAAGIGDPQVRHRGTIGGSLAHADPASDYPTVMLALGAEFIIAGSKGERTAACSSFFTGLLECALSELEILTEIRVPKIGAKGSTYVKFSRRAQDWATVGVAVVSNGDTAVALTNMGPTPLRATGVEEALASGADPAAAAEKAAEGTSPPSDTNGSAEYREHLVKVLTHRALAEALGT